jgi:hypothetical protein
MKTFLIMALAAVLSACGGSSAQTENKEPDTASLRVQPKAGPSDAYSGGINLFRDAHGLSGGTHGHVNTGLYARTRTGAGQTAFEWTGLFLMDNYSNAGENVALYAQANGFGRGPNWALVAECTNAFAPHATCVGAEINVSTTGEDTGNRIGVDVVLADGPLWRGMGPSAVIEGTAAVRIGVSQPSSPHGIWKYGLKVQDKVGVAIDTTGAETKTAIRLKEGQRIELDATGQIKIDFTAGQIRFLNGERVVHSFAMD